MIYDETEISKSNLLEAIESTNIELTLKKTLLKQIKKDKEFTSFPISWQKRTKRLVEYMVSIQQTDSTYAILKTINFEGPSLIAKLDDNEINGVIRNDIIFRIGKFKRDRYHLFILIDREEKILSLFLIQQTIPNITKDLFVFAYIKDENDYYREIYETTGERFYTK